MIKKYPKISVFIIVYNQESFINETIDSVLNQEYPNIEIVIGDDCSTDNTVQILQQYKLKYPDIIKLILSPKNEGITANCNKVLKECTGEYVALLGGDDYWLPTKLKKQIEWFNQNPEAVLCYTPTKAFQSETKEVLYTQPTVTALELMEMDVLNMTYNLGASESSFLIKKDAIPESGFNPLIPTVSDWLFMIQIMYNKKIGGVSEALTMYRRHLNNTSNNLSQIYNEHYITLQIVKNIFPELNNLVREWELDTLVKLCKVNANLMNSLTNVMNMSDLWVKSSNSFRFKIFMKINLKYTFKRILKIR